jgi:hypothetical protein
LKEERMSQRSLRLFESSHGSISICGRQNDDRSAAEHFGKNGRIAEQDAARKPDLPPWDS